MGNALSTEGALPPLEVDSRKSTITFKDNVLGTDLYAVITAIAAGEERLLSD